MNRCVSEANEEDRTEGVVVSTHPGEKGKSDVREKLYWKFKVIVSS